MRLDVVDAVHQQHLADDGSSGFDPRRCRGPIQHGHRIQMHASGIAIAFRRQMHHQHARSVRGLPPVLGLLPAEAAPENGVVEAEVAENLRHLRDMPEQVWQVAHRHRRPEAARDAMPQGQVAHERFAADEKLVGHVVPRADQNAAVFDQPPQPRLVVRPQLEIVLEHDRLAVQMKVREVGL